MKMDDQEIQKHLLNKINDGSEPLREVAEGRVYHILLDLLGGSTNDLPSDPRPPGFGFADVSGFLYEMVPRGYSTDRWVLGILDSNLTAWIWQETRGRGHLGKDVSELDRLGELPISNPHPDLMERLGQRISESSDDKPLAIEVKADLVDLIYSVYGLE